MILTNLSTVPGKKIDRTMGLAVGFATVSGEKKEEWTMEDNGEKWPWADTSQHFETLFRMAEKRLVSSGKKLGGDAVIKVEGKLSRSDNGRPEILLVGTIVKIAGEEEEGGVSINVDGHTSRWEPPSATPNTDELKMLKGRGREKEGPRKEGKDIIIEFGRDIGLPAERMEMLFHAGFRSLEDLSKASVKEITSVEGVNPTQARLIKKRASWLLSEEE
ncbi:MAG: heavy metal-binding domain-containing protein [Candidatus Thermoplasmatota archaeon]|nr:heavy metal-binding domain-containing protein [Candidatus Thermoplasmatota archaeon]